MGKNKKQERKSFSLAREIMSNINNSKQYKSEYGKFFTNLKEGGSNMPSWYVSTGSTNLDLAMTGNPEGGIPSGTIVEIFGLKQSGKSLLALTIAREVQRKGGLVVYFDCEQRFYDKFAYAIGISEDESFVKSDIPFLEKVLGSIEKINRDYLKSKKGKEVDVPLVFIIDSLHAANPEQEYNNSDYDLGGYHTSKARILSQHLHKINYFISKSGASLIILNQMRTNVGAMVGDKYTTTGGMTPEYYSSIRVKLKSTTAYKESGEEVGRNVQAKIVKNSMYRPNLVADFTIKYDSGVDNYLGWYSALEKAGLIKKSGAYSKMDLPDPKTGELIDVSFYKKDFPSKIKELGLEDYIKNKVVDLIDFKYKHEIEEEEKLKKDINSEEE